MTIKEQCEKYLRYKYEYYVLGIPTILDSDFDKFEKNLKDTKIPLALKVTEMVDFPSIREIEELGLNTDNIVDSKKNDETKYPHLTPMLSSQKIQVNDEENMPIHEVELFLNRITSPFIEGTGKYDGSGQEVIYRNNILSEALTRGDKLYGFDKLNKMKYIVPEELKNAEKFKNKTIQVRGELVIDVKLWEKKYSDPNKVDNPRNYVAGVMNREAYSISELKDLTFIAYSLVVIDEKTNQISYPENSMKLLEEFGFNNSYKPLVLDTPATAKGFIEMYEKFKNYKEKECPYLLDGFVIKFPEEKRLRLGENNHHAYWMMAIKFPAQEVSTVINEIIWENSKTGEKSPVGLLEPVELLGTMVQRTSLHNLGFIIRNGCFPGTIISLRKAGEIIPQLTGILEVSPDYDEYMKEFEDFVKECKL